MPKTYAALMVSVAFLASICAAQAQFFGAPQRPNQNAIPDNLDPAMCDQIAAMPNPPMSVEACRSMMGMAQGMKTSSADPSAMRPGDETMTCDQIHAEMRGVSTPMVSAETGERAQAAADAQMALMQKQRGETAGFVAGQMAMGMGTAALGMVPGGGFAAMAAQQAMMAQQQAFAQKQMQDAAPVREQANQALTATTTEMTQGMRENPRVARLMNMSIERNCPSPPDMPPPGR